MAWTWRCEDGDGSEMSSKTAGEESFGNRSDAESWLGEYWADLADEGVAQVVLLDGDEPAAPAMSLAQG